MVQNEVYDYVVTPSNSFGNCRHFGLYVKRHRHFTLNVIAQAHMRVRLLCSDHESGRLSEISRILTSKNSTR